MTAVAAALPPSRTKSVCAHCGGALLGAAIAESDGDAFCCEGCRIVYGLLSQREDGRYYELLQLEQRRAPRAGASREYRQFLEGLREPETLHRIGYWRENRHSLTLECRDMQCAACGWLMERVLGECEGVEYFNVDFLHGEIALRYDAEQSDLPTLLERIGQYGYSFRPKTEARVSSTIDRDAWMRIAVAAACFMNAMAFALGPYFGLGTGISEDWRRLFGLWAYASALPAVLYSAIPFYRGAWRAWCIRTFTIDLTITFGIALAFAVSSISVIQGGAVNYADSLAGLVFFLLLGRTLVRRFEGGLSLRSRWHEALNPGAIRVERGDGFVLLPLDEVKKDDLVEIDAGAFLPVDGIAITASGDVDTAFLTGEDRPRPFRAGDFLFAGYRVLGSRMRLRVANPHGRTRAAALNETLETLASRKRNQAPRREIVARSFTMVVALVAIAAFFLHLRQGGLHALEISASVFIVSCSCALALAVPISRGLGLLRAQRLGFHFRSQETLERLGDLRGVLFDKTGTLTFTQRQVTRWDWLGGAVPESLRPTVLGGVKSMTGRSFHPVSVAIHSGLGDGNLEVTGFSEIPHFGLQATLLDPSPIHLCLCRFGAWEDYDGPFQALGLQSPSPKDFSGPAPQACLFVNGRWAAAIGLTETIKPGVPNLLRGLKALDMPSMLLSGDLSDRVGRFARQCGFDRFQGGLSPEQKQGAAHAFQEKVGPALAVGDGCNDALLFGEAVVAMAVQGASGSMVENAEIFMTSQNPEAILSLFRIAAGVRRSLRNCYILSGVYNGITVSLAVMGWVTPLAAAILMPCASLSLCLTAWLSVPKR